jgi:hypothetical protein
MKPGHTSLAPAQEARYWGKTLLKLRFPCVGNAVPGLVRTSDTAVHPVLRLGNREDRLHLDAGAWGIFHRMAHVRAFPSRLAASDCAARVAPLQPGTLMVTEPDSAFPRAGLYKGGVYYAVNGCRGNLVNVRHP